IGIGDTRMTAFDSGLADLVKGISTAGVPIYRDNRFGNLFGSYRLIGVFGIELGLYLRRLFVLFLGSFRRFFLFLSRLRSRILRDSHAGGKTDKKCKPNDGRQTKLHLKFSFTMGKFKCGL